MLARLKLTLLERGLTQCELARLAGMKPAKVSRIIRGRIKAKARDRRVIARALGMPRAKLFPGMRRRARRRTATKEGR